MSKILVKVVNTVVPIYKRKAGRYKRKRYYLYTVAYKLDGQRVRKNFRQEKKARAFALSVATRIEKGQREILSLNKADWENYVAATKALRPLGVPLNAAISDYIALKSKSNIAPKRIREVVDELLARK